MGESIKELQKRASKDTSARFNLAVMYFNGEGVERDYKKAFANFVKANKAGFSDSSCKYYIAKCYEKGLGTKNDYNKARRFYDAAARDGNLKAKVKLADLYLRGLGCKKNPEGAMNLYTEAAELGSVDAKLGMADCYLNGNGVAQDAEKAVAIFKEVAATGNDKAKYNLAYCYQNGYGLEKDAFMAGHYLVPAAKEGDANAQCYLALCFLKGDAVKQNLPKAVYWFKKAAASGNEVAMFNLAYCMLYGLGTETDEKGAFELLEKLAKSGHVRAFSELARCYELGLGTKKKPVKSFRNIQKGFKLKDPDCQNFMAYYYLGGRNNFVRKNYKKSFKYFSKSANQGNAGATFALGQMYNYSLHVKKDEVKGGELVAKACDMGYPPAMHVVAMKAEKEGDMERALQLYSKATEKEYAPSLVKMGMLTEQGVYVKRDEDKIYNYFKRASVKKSARGFYGLARCYENGIGVPVSRRMAFDCFRIAATCGYKDATVEVGYRYMFGIGTQKERIFAKQYLNKSAKDGDALAVYYIGLGHETGEYYVRNYKKALQFFRTSAKMGYAPAYRKMGIALGVKGKGYKVDHAKSFECFRLGAEAGDVESSVYLANCYLTGRGTEIDYDQADRLIEEACAKNCALGYYKKGQMLFEGLGNCTVKDPENGLVYLEKAAEGGCLEACEYLIAVYSKKKGEYNDAQKLFLAKEKALNAGKLEYLYEIAEGYEKAKLVQRDGDKAAYWYAKGICTDGVKSAVRKKCLKRLRAFKRTKDGKWLTPKMQRLEKKELKAADKKVVEDDRVYAEVAADSVQNTDDK